MRFGVPPRRCPGVLDAERYRQAHEEVAPPVPARAAPAHPDAAAPAAAEARRVEAVEADAVRHASLATSADPRCGDCGAWIMSAPHDPRCPRRPGEPWEHGEPWRVRRIALTPAMRRFEDQLERCNERAFKAWIAAGREVGP
jgi:hypothetical protein